MTANSDKSKIKILIADDEVIIGVDLQDRIRELGYSVCKVASNGEEALALAEAERPDLVLMDVVLRGGLEGIEVADRLRSRFGIPVVFLTAYSDEEKIERAKRTIPFGYVLKPFENRELRIAIEMALFAARADAERKKALEALEASERKYRLIAENVRDVIFTMDMNLRYTYVSPSAYYVRGYQPSEALNLNPEEALTPESLVVAVNAIAEELEAENNPDSDPNRTRMIEIGLIGKDGATVWVEALCSFLRDEDGRPAGILGVGRVISDRKRIEDELRKSEERYREHYLRSEKQLMESREAYRVLVDGLPDTVMRFDREARHLFVSSNFEEIADLPADRFVGRAHRDLGFPEDLCRRWEEAIFKVFESGIPCETEFSFHGKKGPTIFDWRLAPEFDQQGRVASVLAIGRDLTAQREVEGDRKKYM